MAAALRWLRNRARPASQQRSDFRCVLGRDRVADEVHAAMKFVKPIGPKSMPDLIARDARLQKLPARDHAVLARRQPGDLTFGAASERLGAHIPPNPALGVGASVSRWRPAATR
jgi:hypothetical protein